MLKFGFTESEYKVFLYDHDDFNSFFFRFQVPNAGMTWTEK